MVFNKGFDTAAAVLVFVDIEFGIRGWKVCYMGEHVIKRDL